MCPPETEPSASAPPLDASIPPVLTVAVEPAIRETVRRQMRAVGLDPSDVQAVDDLAAALHSQRSVDVVVANLDRCGDRAVESIQALLRVHADALILAIVADPAKVGPLADGDRVFCVTPERLDSFVLWDTVRDVLRFVGFSRSVQPSEPADTGEFRKLLEASADGIVIVAGNGEINYINPRASSILADVDLDAVGRVLASTGHAGSTTELELRPGRVVEVLTAATTWDKRPAFIASIRDATERKQAETELRQLNEHLRELAHTDALTGTLNRRGLATALAGELSDGSRTAILLDLDDFKSINERHGHSVGDTVLAEVGQSIRDALRPSDYVARIGGDEFLVILHGSEEIDSTRAAERVRLVVGSVTVQAKGELVRPTASAGVSLLPGEVREIDQILERTRATLATGKSGGKNRVGTAGARSVIAEVVSQLYRGDGLSAVAQPIVDVASGAVVGYELLSRGPEGVSAMPREFFRLSSEHGILRSVDLSCLGNCIERARGMAAGLVYHVNVYASTVLQTPIDDLIRIIEDGDEPSQRYCIEVCGVFVNNDLTALGERFAQIRARGIAVAIDIEPERLPLDVLLHLGPDVGKVDRAFVQGAMEHPARRRTLERVIEILRQVGCEPIAEGIESDEERALVGALGIRQAQGYLWGRPA